MPPTSVHFNGSVNLPDTETVLREIATRTPYGLRRIPDGETGDRKFWILGILERFRQIPQLETIAMLRPLGEDSDAPAMPHLGVREGVDPADVEWPQNIYADDYAESYGTFQRLRDEGVIAPDTRFQLQYPTPAAFMSLINTPDVISDDPLARFKTSEPQKRLNASFERALFADLDRALDRLPRDNIAVQWDIAGETTMIERLMPLSDHVDNIARCVDRVPADVPGGLHLCYGDYAHQHAMDPESLTAQVSLANAVVAAAARTVDFIAFTVPQHARDEAFFAPIRDLDTGPDTELFFAVVPYHPTEQAAGTTAEQVRLIDQYLPEATSARQEWGICTECGMGRVADDEQLALLDLHRDILATHGVAYEH